MRFTFIEYVLAGKTLLGYTDLTNDKIIYKYVKDKYGRRSLEFIF